MCGSTLNQATGLLLSPQRRIVPGVSKRSNFQSESITTVETATRSRLVQPRKWCICTIKPRFEHFGQFDGRLTILGVFWGGVGAHYAAVVASDEPYLHVPGCQSGSATTTPKACQRRPVKNGSYEPWKTLNCRIYSWLGEKMQHGNSRGRQNGIRLDRDRVAVDHWLRKSVS
jgi:hypothetical protein